MTALVRAVASPAVDDHWPRRQSAEDPWPAKVEVCLHRLHEHLERLYRVLVAPILPAVHDREHWVIVPHGPLHHVPWCALRTAHRYLVQDRLVSILPSASVGAVLGGQTRTAGPALIFADPPAGPDRRLIQGHAEVAAALRTPNRMIMW
jgi:hypothetical protein